MAIKIPLLPMEQSKDAKAHCYPFQICMQTQEFLQASIFYAAFTDVATAEYIRIDGKLEEIEKSFTERLYSKETYDECWDYLQKYFDVFKKSAFQNVLVPLNSHWDWYVRRLAEFIAFAREHVESPTLNKAQQNDFCRIGNCPIYRQLEIIEIAAGLTLELDEKDIANLKEMSRTRNLGLHNRWEVDERYLELTGREDFELGELRIVEIDEINRWYESLINTLGETCRKTAVKYVSTPSYP